MRAADVLARIRVSLARTWRALAAAARAAWSATRRLAARARPALAGVSARVRPLVARLAAWTRPRAAAASAWLRPRASRAAAAVRRALSAAARRTRTAALAGASGARRVARAARRPLRLATRTLAIAAAIFCVALGAGWTFLHRVPPGVVAVRQAQWGGRGVVERDFGPGLHLTVRGRDAWYELPAGSQILRFAWKNEGGDEDILPAATREGEAAQVAVVVAYRILPGSAWRVVADGLRGDYRLRAVAVCRRVLLEELGALTAAELVDPDRRAAVERSALARLATELAATHLEAIDVRLGTTFFNPTYEKKLFERQLATQDELTRASLAARAAEARVNEQLALEITREVQGVQEAFDRELEVLRNAHQVALADLARESERHAREVRSRTDLDVLRLGNESELALASAAALRERLFAQARTADTGRLDVARQAARNLRIGRVVLDPADPGTPNVLDLDVVVDLLMGGSGEE